MCLNLLYSLKGYNNTSSCSTINMLPVDRKLDLDIFRVDYGLFIFCTLGTGAILQEMRDWGVCFQTHPPCACAQVALNQRSPLWWLCGLQLSHHKMDIFSVLVERPAFCCILAKSETMITAGGNIDRVNRWLLLNEMKLQWSILFVTHPQNRNDYGLLATEVMDIECLLTMGL